MKIGVDIHRFERCSVSFASAAERSADKDVSLRLLCDGLETWYNIFITGRGDKIVHVFQDKMTFTPGDCLRLEAGGAETDGTFFGLGVFAGLVSEDGGRPITWPRSKPSSAADKGE